jgi:hypothetical protein
VDHRTLARGAERVGGVGGRSFSIPEHRLILILYLNLSENSLVVSISIVLND